MEKNPKGKKDEGHEAHMQNLLLGTKTEEIVTRMFII
jgi:hypothetical protein